MKSFKRYLKEDWWDDLGPDGQERYIKDHPNSTKAKTAKQEKQSNNSKKTPFEKRKEIADLSTVKIPRFSEADVKKAQRDPYIFTKEGSLLLQKLEQARSENDESAVEYYSNLIDNNNRKYNIESISHLEGALDSTKYYVSEKDFNNPNVSTFDILKVNRLNNDGTYEFTPMGGKYSDRLNAKDLGSTNLIELDDNQAKELFTTMPSASGVFGGLSQSDKRLISTYTYATPENSALRKGKTTQRSENMKNIINRAYNKDERVYRGIRGEYANKLLNLEVGDVITEPGFSSTTHDEDVAKKFAKDGVVLDIEVPEGWGNMLNVSEYTLHPEESESIIQSGARFKIVGKEGNTIKVKLLPFNNK